MAAIYTMDGHMIEIEGRCLSITDNEGWGQVTDLTADEFRLFAREIETVKKGCLPLDLTEIDLKGLRLLATSGQVLNAVKFLRLLKPGIDLREAKEFVESL